MILHDDTNDIEYNTAMRLHKRQMSDEQLHRVEMRGGRETAPKTRTTVWRGHYAEGPALRSEFFSACGMQRNEI